MKSLSTLFNMLPTDVIINHIAPYTYQTKPEKLMSDIRSFVCQYQMVEEYYLTILNDHIFLHDLARGLKASFTTNSSGSFATGRVCYDITKKSTVQQKYYLSTEK